jgi:hypothetical protein
MKKTVNKNIPSANSRLQQAIKPVFEVLENRMLLSSTIAAWTFSNYAVSTTPNLTPVPTTGTGSAVSVGFQTGTTSTKNTLNPYPYPNPAASGSTSGDISDMVSAANTDLPETGSVAWRVRGNSDGWSSNAAIGSQGVQFLTSTAGYSGISVKFDFDPSSGSAASELEVQYTTNGGTTWNNATALSIGTASNGSTAGISVATNSTVSTIVNGSYFQVANNATGLLWENNLVADFSGVTAANNNPNFGVRFVNAATGASEYEVTGTGATPVAFPTAGAGNWRFDDVQILASGAALSAPTITTQPTNEATVPGTAVTFTAAATGNPAPTVQWYSGTPSSPTLISGATSPSYTFTPTAAQNNTTYFAIFSNSQGTATTNVVTLSVNASPVITTQPTNQDIQAGSPATFTAVATGSPTPTVQWQVSTNGTSFTNISGATSTTYTVTAASTNANTAYRAVFTNTAGTATSNAATLTVIGEPISQWIFNTTVPETIETNQSDATLISADAGSADAPLATFTGNPYNASTGTGDIAQTSGLFNDYQGTPVFSGADINAVSGRSTINPNYDNYSWRIRSSHTIDGWSQLAPEETTAPDGFGGTLDPQGVVFHVNTTGYSDITLHFQWLGGGIADMQPQYSPDGGTTWINAGSILQNFSNDYPGITATTTPPGYYVSLEGSQYANAYNNPNFELRLVAAYDPNLPLITDGNQDEPLAVHGQYASSKAGAQNAQQVLDLGGSPTYGANQQNVSGGTFELSFEGQTTVPISWTSSTFITDIQTALDNLSTIGGVGGSVAVSQELITPYTTASASNALLNITFGGSLGDQVVPTLTVTNNQLTGTSPTATVSTWVPGAAAAGVDANGNEVGVTRFEDGSGTWELSDFSFNALTSSGAPTVVTQPASATIVGGTSNTFTATDYSESSPVSAQWQINTGSGWSNIAGATNYTASTNSSSYTFTSNANLSDSGDQFRVVFTNPNGSTDSVAATLTTVAPVAPSVTSQPIPEAAQVGFPAVFTATATGSPPPTVQWQVNTGSGWTNVANSVTVTGATTTTLTVTALASQVGVSTQYRALFTNEVTSVPSNAAAFTALAAETTITDWNFASDPTGVNDSPAPSIGSGTATGLGMSIPYNPSDPASGTDGLGSINIDDITSTSGAANPALTENTWRIRGGTTAGVAGAPANGWSNFAQEYTQGAEWAVSTAGYNSVYITMDWYSTTSGELNAREQYTPDGVNWYNVDDNQLAYNGTTNPSTGLDDLDPNDPYAPLNALSNDFYGATSTSATTAVTAVSLTNNVATLTANNSYQVGQTVNVTGVASPNTAFNGIFTITAATSTSFSYALTGSNVATTSEAGASASLGGYIVPLVFNLTGIAAANNDPNFAIRLVNAYNPSLPLISSTLIGDNEPTTHGQYAVASSAASPTPYPGSAGNWRFDNILFHGNSTTQPAWLGTGSQATFNSTTKVLTVTGPTTIIADPGTDEPIIVASGSAATVSINPGSGDTVNIGGLQLSNGAVVTMASTTTSDILIVAPGGPVTIDASSKLNLGKGYADFQASSQSQGQSLLGTVNGLITTGYANGTWTGDGITSSVAAGNTSHLTALGVILNNGVYGTGAGSLGTFDGTNPGTYDVLAHYTYYGDANLNGEVDGSDYSLIDSAFAAKAAGTWGNGDFNYDGVIDGSDYTLIDNAFNSQGAQIEAMIQASPTAQIAGANSTKSTKGSPFATGSAKSTFVQTFAFGQSAVAGASIESIEQLMQKDKSNTLAGSIVNGLLN